MRYRERLWPAWWVWPMPALLVGVIAVAYGAAYGLTVGLAIGIPAALVATAMLRPLSPNVTVDGESLRAGRARLPLEWVGAVRVLGRADLAEERRRGDARTYLVLRPWTAATAVWVGVTDPADPHPAWLITSRHPEALASALRSAEVAPGGPDAAESDP